VRLSARKRELRTLTPSSHASSRATGEVGTDVITPELLAGTLTASATAQPRRETGKKARAPGAATPGASSCEQ
jgi:hypothetical protein